jgi:23S rRNA pseudouridine1911/1915/1917 synthase
LKNNTRPGAHDAFIFTVNEEQAHQRLDAFLSQQFSMYSRSFLQRLIQEKQVILNNKPANKSSIILKLNDSIVVQFPNAPELSTQKIVDPNITIDIIFEHEHFLIINKPAGLMVHTPNHESQTPTLVDWIIAHYKEIALTGQADRPGIVHRLDKDTSGVLIIGRTNYAHITFGAMFENRTIHKTYLALVHGHPAKTGSIDLSIGRSPHLRTKMTTVPATQLNTIKARAALTHYTVLEYFKDYSLVHVKPVTGRTHQIRVHMAAIGHPIMGDTVYGKASGLINRQALHAQTINFIFDAKEYTLTADIPADMQKIIEKLRTFMS